MEQFDLQEMRAWATEAGTIAKSFFNHTTGRRKANNTLVSEADEAIEKVLVERITARYPDHGIIGEEHARRAGAGEFLWALDPLDGTASFLAGLAMWCVSIGVLRAGQPYLGVIYIPLLDACYWNDEQGRAFLNDDQIQVAEPHEWDTEDWLAVPSNIHRRYQIDFRGKVRSIGSTAASICYVARGTALGALLGRTSLWDIAAAVAILNAAGGQTFGLSGRPLDLGPMLGGAPAPEPLLAVGPDPEKLRAAITLR